MFLLIDKPKQVAHHHFLLMIESQTERSTPGQFINIRISNQNDPLLRRPFSIFDHEDTKISIVIKTVGRGTEILSRLQPEKMDVIGPLGTGFTLQADRKVLIAGGGVGNAPLYYLAKKLAELHCHITHIYGARSGDSVYLQEQFKKHANEFILTTDDGSEGRMGLATDIASKIIYGSHFDMIYTCGPSAMMKGIVEAAQKIPVEVSLENYFGCGIGICSGCAIETKDGPKRACIEGPVFNGKIIKWDTMPD
jgi:dihydroorotate dehydrogenase electron transfer subunit